MYHDKIEIDAFIFMFRFSLKAFRFPKSFPKHGRIMGSSPCTKDKGTVKVMGTSGSKEGDGRSRFPNEGTDVPKKKKLIN